MSWFHRGSRKLQGAALALVIISGQVAGVALPFMPSAVVHAAPLCTVDSAGANDEPGQKDLTLMCVDYTGAPTTVDVTWDWDELGSSGANTLDGCSLFDTDGDGFINYSVCVTTTGNPAVLDAVTTYSCGDAKVDRCTSTAAVVASGTTNCTVTQPLTGDPFAADDAYPRDTQAHCVIDLSTVGSLNAKLIDVCSYPSGQPNSDPSDCVLARAKAGKLEVVKSLSPTDDPGLFNLQIDGITKATDVTNGGNTGEVVVSAADHSVGELAGTGTNLSGYTTTIVCKDLHGTGTIVAQGTSTSLDPVPVADGSDVVCTITNTRAQGSVTLIKSVTNNNGGTAGVNEFGLTIGGQSVTSGQTLSFNSGSTPALNETGKTGYSFESLTGTGCPAQLGGTVTVVAGQNITCTITNNDIAPSLTLNKVVSNTHGGNAAESAWTLTATGTGGSPTNLSGAGAAGTNDVVSTGTFKADTYALAENGGPSGYTASLWTCTNGVTVTAGHITLANGQTTVCTITNSDNAPSLTVTKVVQNPYGTPLPASAFPLYVDATQVTSGVANTQFNAGNHAISETQQFGYTRTGLSGDCSLTDQATINVLLSVGVSSTCTLTNSAIQPKLVVIKHVVNNNGGSKTAGDFTMTVSGNSQTVPNFAGNEAGTNVGLNEGNYSVDELADSGYAKSFTGDCSSTIAVGETKTCTITNNDIAPSLTLNKVVSNTHGGNAAESAWTLTATGTGGSPTNLSGAGAAGTNDVVSTGTFKADTYALAENGGPSGYTASLWTCTNGVTVTAGHITLANGQTTVCTITNSDNAPSLTVTKVVQNPYGTPLPASAFPLYVDATQVTSGVANTQFNAGNHAISETQQFGYTRTGLSGDCSLTDQATINVLLSVGVSSTCTLTNSAIQPKLVVIKHVVNNNGGSKTAGDFTMTVSGNSQTVPNFAGNEAGTNVGLNEGNYSVDELADSGYAKSFTGDCSSTIAVGETKTCTITNNDIAPSLTLNKVVSNTHGGNAAESAWTLTATGTGGSPTNLSGAGAAGTNDVVSTGTFKADTYALAENGGPSGYTASLWTCTNGVTVTAGHITLANGQTTVCTITNSDVAPTLSLHKLVVNDNSGVSTPSDFTLSALPEGDAINTLSGNGGDGFIARAILAHLAYDLSEDGPSGYTAGDWDCFSSAGVFSNPDGLNNVIRLSEGAIVDCTITNFDIPHPSIQVVKSGPATAHEGDEVTYTFTVTNTGDVALSGLTVNDNIAGAGTYQSGDTNDNDVLETTETWIYTATYTIPADQEENVVNTATVCSSIFQSFDQQFVAVDEVSDEAVVGNICDTDDHTLDVLHPAIKVVKTGPATASAGSQVTYTFTVTNTGDTPLNGLTVIDSITGNATYVSGDTNNDQKLDLTETWIYTATYTIPANQLANVVNTVTVCGIDGATDPAQVCAQSRHSLGIPQVLAETTLVNTGEAKMKLVTVLAMFNIVLVAGAYLLTNDRKSKNQ